MTSLNPVLPVGLQMTEALRSHTGMAKADVCLRRRTSDLGRPALTPPNGCTISRSSSSGGQRQRHDRYGAGGA